MISSKVPLEELKSLVRAELNFDRAFSVLQRKYDFQYENLVEVLEAIDSGEIDISSEEEKGSHVTSYHFSDDEDEEGDKGNDSEDDVDDSAQEVTKEDGKDDDDDEEHVSVGSSANSENEDESEDEEEETKEDEEEEKEYKSDKLFPHIIPQKADTQLAMLAYSFGKVLHHSILSAERVATLQQKVTELQRELFTLRTAAKWYLQDSLKQKRNGSNGSNNSRRKLNAADLKAFKEVARKEVEQMVAAANSAQTKAEAKYKRIIASLELAVNYLKLEGNGRVQQMQMMDYSAREMGQVSEAREEALRQMWHELCCQVALNRIKAINQLANVNAQQGAETEEEDEEDEDEDEDEDEEGNEERHQHQHQHPLSDEEKVALHLCTLLSEGCPATSPAALDYLSLGLTLRYVSLRLKKGQGLGVYIIGGPERHSPLIVSSVCKKGAAARAARPASGLEGDTNPHQGPLIAPGDILLSVNGFDLSASTVEQATKLFLSIGGWCRLGLLRLPFDDVEDLFREEEEEEEEEDDEEESEEEVEGDLEAIEEEEDGDEESDSEDDEETSDSEEDEEEEEESTESDDVADDYSNTFEIV